MSNLIRSITYFASVLLLLIGCRSETNDWQRINMGFNDNFHDIAPIDINNLIAYSYGSGKIVKSRDQGITWHMVFETDSVYYEQIEFPSRSVGYICGNTNKILKTEDSGNNWVEITIDSISETAPIYGMKFISPEVGYLSVMQRSSEGISSRILKTADSGLNWKEVNSVPEMILNLELVNNELWGSGNNVVLKNIDKINSETVYYDPLKEVGQIRDFLIEDDNIVMVSFNGYVVKKTKNSISKQQITTNRIRSVVKIGNGKLIVAGDNNKEKGNLFRSLDNGKTWILSKQNFNDIHRLKTKDGIVWGIGKNDEVLKMEL